MHLDICHINEHIAKHSFESLSLNLETGKMGMCIYFNNMAKIFHSDRYRKIANQLLTQTHNALKCRNKDLSIYDIAQIGCAINYLIEQGNMDGNINSLLKDYDDVIYLKTQSLIWVEQKPIDLMVLLYYMRMRLNKLKKGSCDFIVMSDLCMQTFNNFYLNIITYLSDEPLLFTLEYNMPSTIFLFSKLYTLQIFNNRIDEILKEISSIIMSRIPILHVNRLYLLWALVCIKNATRSSIWDENIGILHDNIEWKKIVDELIYQDLSVRNGWTGIYLLLLQIKPTPYCVYFDQDILIRHLEHLDSWQNSQWQSYPIGLINGISGALLLYSSIINNKTL